MIETYFLFGGRLKRLQYFLAGLVINLIGGGILFMAIMKMTSGGGTPILALVAAFGILFFWISLSIQTARIRDIGLNPLFTIVGFAIVYGIAHALKTQMAGSSLAALLSALTMGLQILASLCLLFMPADSFSRIESTSPPEGQDTFDRRSDLVRQDPMTMTRARPAAAAPTSHGYARPTFGRRGM